MLSRIIGKNEDGLLFTAIDEHEGTSVVTKTSRNPDLKIGDYFIGALLSEDDDDFYLEYQREATEEDIDKRKNNEHGFFNHLFDDTLLENH